MTTYTKAIPSGSTNGRVIPVVATATPGTLIHTAVAGTGAPMDEVWIFAANVSNSDATLTIEYGGVTNPGDHIVDAYNIPAHSPLIPIVQGFPLRNSLVIRAFSNTANAINIAAFVNSLT